MITPLPGAWSEKPGSATLPFFGAKPVILDPETGAVLEGVAEGVLCFAQAWPSTIRGVYNDTARFEATYFAPYKGYYFSGDGARRDADGYYWITGRVDDVINVSGHRYAFFSNLGFVVFCGGGGLPRFGVTTSILCE